MFGLFGTRYIAGLSHAGPTAQSAVFRMSGKKPLLHSLSEIRGLGKAATAERGPVGVAQDPWFLNAAPEGLRKKLSSLSIGLDNHSLTILSFPVEASLTPVEREGQIDWELSRFIEGYAPDGYVKEVREMGEVEGSTKLLAVAARKEYIVSIQSTLGQRKLAVGSIEANFFGALTALARNYPETASATVALVTVDPGRADIGTVVNGRLTSYRYLLSADSAQIAGFIAGAVITPPVSHIYFAGTAIDHVQLHNFRTKIDVNASMLNPVREVGMTKAFLKDNPFAGAEFRFTAAIGCALSAAQA